MKRNLFVSFFSFSFILLSASQSVAQTNSSPNLQMDNAIHDYILNHPEVIVQSLEAYQTKQYQQALANAQANAVKYADAIFHQSNDPVAGNPKGKVTLVEFLDYQCPHCIVMSPVIDSLIKANPELRVVLKDFPVRGPISVVAATAALASKKQGKYYEFNKALMGSKVEPLTEDTIYDIAKSVGINVDKLKSDMKDKAIAQQIKSNYELAGSLQVQGTPTFIVAKTDITTNAAPTAITVVPGEATQDQLEKIIQKAGE